MPAPAERSGRPCSSLLLLLQWRNGLWSGKAVLRYYVQPWLFPRFEGIGLAVCLALAAAGCSGRPEPKAPESAYVRGARAPLRDQLGPSSNLTGTLESGERVEVLAKRPRWVQVRSASGRTGWIQSRFLASPAVFDQFRLLAVQTAPLPSQGKALLRREANLHHEPRRDSETFYRLPEGEEVEVLAHRVVDRASPAGHREENASAESESNDEAPVELEIQAHEDWFLVRASGGKAGWLLENLMDMNLPVEIARYREGLRIRAWFVIHREMDEGVERPWYLWATIRPVTGLPFDFDEIRVFVWNPARSRYETSYRERNLIGFYPIQAESQEASGSGVPAFRLQLEDETGKRFQRNYVMAGRLVRRAP